LKNEYDESLGVFLTMSEFKTVLAELEELEDIRAVEVFENRKDKEFIPFQQALDEIKNGFIH